MDTITHGIVGALAGKALFAGRDVPARSTSGLQANAESSPIARVAIMACTVGSIFPDIDIFAGSIAKNPLAILEWHRNITHSFLMLPLWALLLAAMSLPIARWLQWKPPSFGKLTLIYAVGLATHIFLDVVTNFGTMVWSPLNIRARPGIGCSFSISFSPAWRLFQARRMVLSRTRQIPHACRCGVGCAYSRCVRNISICGGRRFRLCILGGPRSKRFDGSIIFCARAERYRLPVETRKLVPRGNGRGLSISWMRSNGASKSIG